MNIPLSLLDLAVAASAFSGTLRAQTGSGYPSKPMRVVAPFPPVSGADSIARLFGPSIHEWLGQPPIVDNHSEAGTIIRGELLAKALTDGQGHRRISDRPSATAAGRYPIAFKKIRDESQSSISPEATASNIQSVHGAQSAGSDAGAPLRRYVRNLVMGDSHPARRTLCPILAA